jgi:hypothetical protein
MITTQNQTGAWVKKLILMLLIACSLLLIMSCLNPLDETSTENGGDGTGGSTSEELELLPAPGILSFTFTPAQLVVGTDSIEGGEVAGTLTAQGGSGSYSFEKLEGGADDALFELADNELIIASDVVALDPGPYSILVKVTDSVGLSAQKYCKMEVTRSPALITTAPKVYPSMLYDGTTKAETGFNKITVQWSQSVGATDYTIYISKASNPSVVESYELTEENAATAGYKLEIDTFGGSGLPKGKTYLVWLTAKNDDGATPAGPKATVTTSQPVQEWWYQDEEGNGIIRWDSDTDEYVFNATTVAYGMSKYPDISFTSYKGVIRHHVKFDRDEARTVQRYTQIGKWGENLSAGESGVIIIEYIHPGMENYNNPDDMDDGVLRNHRPPYLMNPGLAAGSERYFFGVYYWGAGATFQPSAGHANHILAKPHIGMRMMYSSNSWPLSGNVGPCDKATYEEALDIYTLKNMHHYIAFIATPWYPVFDGMVYASVGYPCPHHHPKTASGRLMTSGTYNGQYEYTFTNQHAGTQIGVSFDIGAEGLPAGQQARTGFKLADYGDYVMTKTVYSPTSTVQYAMTDDVLSVINTTPGVIMFP